MQQQQQPLSSPSLQSVTFSFLVAFSTALGVARSIGAVDLDGVSSALAVAKGGGATAADLAVTALLFSCPACNVSTGVGLGGGLGGGAAGVATTTTSVASRSSPLALIAGAAVGGFILLACVALGFYVFVVRKGKWGVSGGASSSSGSAARGAVMTKLVGPLAAALLRAPSQPLAPAAIAAKRLSRAGSTKFGSAATALSLLHVKSSPAVVLGDATTTSMNPLHRKHSAVEFNALRLGGFAPTPALVAEIRALEASSSDAGALLERAAALRERGGGSLALALILTQKALRLQRAAGGDWGGEALETHGRLVELLEATGEHEEAAAAAAEASYGLKVTRGRAHPTTVDAIFRQAKMVANLERPKPALRFFHEALAGFRINYGDLDPRTTNCIRETAVCLLRCGQDAEAAELQAECERLEALAAAAAEGRAGAAPVAEPATLAEAEKRFDSSLEAVRRRDGEKRLRKQQSARLGNSLAAFGGKGASKRHLFAPTTTTQAAKEAEATAAAAAAATRSAEHNN